MKKFFATVTVLLLILGCVSCFAEGELVELYKSDFTADKMDGWVANNAKGSVDKKGNFVISGRTADWMAPIKTFPLKPGIEYKVTVEVYQDVLDKALFSITIAQDDANWRHLCGDEDPTVPKGKWTKLEAVFTLEPFGKYQLYVESPKNTNDYKIRNFTIYGPEGAL